MTLFLAMVLDAVLGEPKWAWDRAPHPAVLMGRAIGWADTTFNTNGNRTLKGVLMVVFGCAACWALGWLIEALPTNLMDILVLAILLAQRSLCDHVRAVAMGLNTGVGDGRAAVARIVGRDTAEMDGTDVARAAIESGAENLSDGVIAPIFWFAVAGLPGVLIYKFVNTADSMVGYRTPRHAQFGWAAARLDDVLNFVPARISAALVVLVTARPDAAGQIVQEAPRHRSPNAGWPEAAFAHALGVALSGPRSYHGKRTDDPFVNPAGRRTLDGDDIEAAVSLMWRVWLACLAAAAIFALFQLV